MPQQTDLEQLLKPQTIAALRTATGGTCELLDPDSSLPRAAITSPREVAPERVKQLAALLLDPASWFLAVKRCLPKPTALVRLNSSLNRELRIEFSVPCSSWSLTTNDEHSGGFYDPVRDEIEDTLKATFPEYASPQRRSMWRAGAIAELKARDSSEGDGSSWSHNNGWILAALAMQGGTDVSLPDLIAAADVMNHAIPTSGELSRSLTRFARCGLIKVDGKRYRILPEHLPSIRKALTAKGGLFTAPDKCVRWLNKSGLRELSTIRIELKPIDVTAAYKQYLEMLKRR